MNVYDFINWFFMYSFPGYLLECIVLNVGYKRPVVGHGFDHGPFCVIYGFGALGACMLLRPVSGGPMELCTTSTVMVTTMELVTASIMVRLFGPFWWNYSHKPFSYKGMICLESSPGQGLLGLFFFYLPDIRVRAAVFSLPGHIRPVSAVGLTTLYLVGFIRCFRLRLGGMEDEDAPAVDWLKIY